MTNEQTIGTCIAKYGAIEYELIPNNDDIAWRKITDLSLFCKAIYLTSKGINEYVKGEKDYEETMTKLKQVFLKKCGSEEYEIIYCPNLQKNFVFDPVFIRLYWIASRKEKQQLELIRNFINLYYFSVINGYNEDTKKAIWDIQKTMKNDWIIVIKYLYQKYAKGTHYKHILEEICHTIEILIDNASKDNSAPFHQLA